MVNLNVGLGEIKIAKKTACSILAPGLGSCIGLIMYDRVNDIAKGLADQYAKSDKVSTAFCKIKFTSIETSADKIQTVTAGRPR